MIEIKVETTTAYCKTHGNRHIYLATDSAFWRCGECQGHAMYSRADFRCRLIDATP